jgi:hypothetical protein
LTKLSGVYDFMIFVLKNIRYITYMTYNIRIYTYSVWPDIWLAATLDRWLEMTENNVFYGESSYPPNTSIFGTSVYNLRSIGIHIRIRNTPTATLYIYMYMYMCVCVCMYIA